MSNRSRITQAAPTGTQGDPNDEKNASQVHSVLLSLGAPPELTLDDFTRLYHGPFGELLLFVSTQIKGRKQVARDRHAIHQYWELRSKLPARLPEPEGTVKVAPNLISMANMHRAQRELDTIKAQFEESQAEFRETHAHHSSETVESQVADLKQALREKRRAALLLRILEEKERVRIRRFQEIIKMVETLGNASAEVLPPYHPVEPVVIPPKPNISLTHTTATNLHAYYTRLCRIRDADHEPSPLLTSRLRLRLAKKIQADQVESVLERYCEIARVKAKNKTSYRDSLLSQLPSLSEGDLTHKAKENELKRLELQQLSDNAVALGFLCEHLITSISVFLEDTSPILRSSIQGISSAKGYIDALRLSLVASKTSSASKETGQPFLDEVQGACKVKTTKDSETILREIEGLVRRVNEHSSFLAKVDALRFPSPTPEEEALISEYRTSLQIVEKKERELLTRKVEKAARGDSLKDDIEILKKGVLTMIG